ncbi:TRAM domain-containing protein [Guggenheimella bovis]
MRRAIRILIMAISLVLGFVATYFLIQANLVKLLIPDFLKGLYRYGVLAVGTIIFGFIFYFLLLLLRTHGTRWLDKLSEQISKYTPIQIVGGALGLLITLTLAFFLSQLYHFIQVPVIPAILAGVSYLMLSYLGITLGAKIAGNITLPQSLSDFSLKHPSKKVNASPKVLDSSAIIDGRIVEIARTGFIEGEIVIGQFILKELRHIADSSDDLTRTKGRRGLDFIKELQNQKGLQVTISNRDYDNIEEVDLKLLKLALDLKGSVVTTDYNLNKVAVLQNIPVLNVNDLSNAVKPNAIPGEVFSIEIIKRGKEAEQGVGYLSDGTMIVVDRAKNRIGEELEVEVTSVLQTPAGRMIFAKIKE